MCTRHPTSMEENQATVFELTNTLGISATVHVNPYCVISYGEGSLVEDLCPSTHLLVQPQEDIYVTVPLHSFDEVRLEGKTHVVTLKSGKSIKGKLFGSIMSQSGDRTYGLQSATTLKLVHDTLVPVHFDFTRDAWTLHSQYQSAREHRVCSPKLGFRYWETYTDGGIFSTPKTRPACKQTASFAIEVKGQKVPVWIEDLAGLRTTPNAPSTITLEAPNGTVTTGKLILEVRGGTLDLPKPATTWLLVSELADPPGCMLFVNQLGWQLTKIGEPVGGG